MNEREQSGKGSSPGVDPRDERLQSLLQAAYPAAEPDEALQQNVAELVARHAARAARPRRGAALPFGGRPAAGLLAAAALVAVLGLTLARWDHGQPAVSPQMLARRIEPDSLPQAPPTHQGTEESLPRKRKTSESAKGEGSNRTGKRFEPEPSAPGFLPGARPHAFGAPASSRRPDFALSPHSRFRGKDFVAPSRGPAPRFAPPPSRMTAPRDDLAFVNGDPEQALRPWVPVPRVEWGRIEAQVRRSVRVKDDFVTIPFPRIASTSTRPITQAIEGYKRQAAIVDPRLTREVTLQFKGIALSDLCDRLREDTGIELSAGPSVADEKVTVFCDKTPLRSVMRQFSHAFGYTWLRTRQSSVVSRQSSGEDPSDSHVSRLTPHDSYRYELEQDLRSQLLEEELRNRDWAATLVALDAQLQQFRPYLGMSFEELKKRWDAIAPEKKRNPWERFDDNSGIGQMWLLVAKGWGGVQLYHRLTARDRAALMAGEELIFRPDAPDPDHRFPAAWNRPLLLQMNIPDTIDGRPTGIAAAPDVQIDEVRLGVHRDELGQVSFAVGLSASSPELRNHWGSSNPQMLTARSPSEASPNNTAANAALRGRPPFDQGVSLRPKPCCPVVKEEPGDKDLLSTDSTMSDFDPSQSHASSADVWEAVHRATGLPIVADYYTHLYPLSQVTAERQPLFEALCKVGEAMGVRWRKDDGFLVCRSASFFLDRLKEVPNRYLQQWARDRDVNGGLPLTDFLEMARMSDQQLDSAPVAYGIERYWGLREWAWARDARRRENARCLALLSAEQLRRAQEPDGLPFKELAPAQQQQIMRLQYETEEALAGKENPAPSMRSPEEFAGTLITAFYVPAGWYLASQDPSRSDPREEYAGIAADAGSNAPPAVIFHGVGWLTGGRTEAEVAAAARRRYPRAPLQPVRRAPDGLFNALIQ